MVSCEIDLRPGVDKPADADHPISTDARLSIPRRDQDPRGFRQNVWFTIIMGAVMFVFNLCISWVVMSR